MTTFNVAGIVYILLVIQGTVNVRGFLWFHPFYNWWHHNDSSSNQRETQTSGRMVPTTVETKTCNDTQTIEKVNQLLKNWIHKDDIDGTDRQLPITNRNATNTNAESLVNTLNNQCKMEILQNIMRLSSQTSSTVNPTLTTASFTKNVTMSDSSSTSASAPASTQTPTNRNSATQKTTSINTIITTLSALTPSTLVFTNSTVTKKSIAPTTPNTYKMGTTSGVKSTTPLIPVSTQPTVTKSIVTSTTPNTYKMGTTSGVISTTPLIPVSTQSTVTKSIVTSTTPNTYKMENTSGAMSSTPLTSVSTKSTTTDQLVNVPYACDKIKVLTAIFHKNVSVNPDAGLCSDGTHSNSEAFVRSCCNVPVPNKWTAGVNVASNCHRIPTYSPIAMFLFGKYPMDGQETSGILIQCDASGVKVAIQLCGQPPQIYHLDSSGTSDPRQTANKYSIIV